MANVINNWVFDMKFEVVESPPYLFALTNVQV